jgi:quercetin dioxygenase-like cupin family protein
MEIVKGSRTERQPSDRRTATFTGVVYGEPLLAGADGVAVTSVFFAPGARTYWHSHDHGQVLRVLDGHGLVCEEGGEPQCLDAGDLVWALPGEVHWHGGAPDSMLLHLAISMGTTNWLGPVSDDDYGGGR